MLLYDARLTQIFFSPKYVREKLFWASQPHPTYFRYSAFFFLSQHVSYIKHDVCRMTPNMNLELLSESLRNQDFSKDEAKNHSETSCITQFDGERL